MDQHPLANRGPLAQALPLQARMADRGTRFNNAYTVLPICSPARASMLTGLYPHVHGLTENDGRFGGRAGLGSHDWMVHRDIATAGYKAAWFGKWHLDNHSDAGRFGFQGWSLPGYGYPYAAPDYADYLQRKKLPPPVVVVELTGESLAPPGTRWSLQELPDWPEYEAGSLLLDGPAETHEAFFVADLASNWIRQNTEDPFFLRVDPWGPHPPVMVPAEFSDRLPAEADFRPANFWSDLSHRPVHHRDYRDSWSKLHLQPGDWRLLAKRSLQQAMLVETALCGLLDTLEATGIVDHTLIVVCADHGDAVASNGGLANKGSLLVEETSRIPLLLAGPGVPPRQTIDHPVSNLDIAPSLLAACYLPERSDAHGFDLGPMMRGERPPDRRGAATLWPARSNPSAWLAGRKVETDPAGRRVLRALQHRQRPGRDEKPRQRNSLRDDPHPVKRRSVRRDGARE